MLVLYNVSYLFSLCCRTSSHPLNVHVVSTTAMEQSLLSLHGLDMVHECSHVHHVYSVQGIDYMHVSFYPVCVLCSRVKCLVVWLYTCMCKLCESKMFLVFYQS